MAASQGSLGPEGKATPRLCRGVMEAAEATKLVERNSIARRTRRDRGDHGHRVLIGEAFRVHHHLGYEHSVHLVEILCAVLWSETNTWAVYATVASPLAPTNWGGPPGAHHPASVSTQLPLCTKSICLSLSIGKSPKGLLWSFIQGSKSPSGPKPVVPLCFSALQRAFSQRTTARAPILPPMTPPADDRMPWTEGWTTPTPLDLVTRVSHREIHIKDKKRITKQINNSHLALA